MDRIICKCGAHSYEGHLDLVSQGQAAAHTYKADKAFSQVASRADRARKR